MPGSSPRPASWSRAPTDNAILAGITRHTLKVLAGDLQLKLVERPFTLAEAKDAQGSLHHQRHLVRDAGGQDRRRRRWATARSARRRGGCARNMCASRPTARRLREPTGTLKPPRAILFDWDNTLVDTWPTIVECYHDTFTALGQTPWTARGGARSGARLAARRLSRVVRRARGRSRKSVLRDLPPHPSRAPDAVAGGGGASGTLQRSRLLCRGGEQQGRRQSAGPSSPISAGQRWIQRAVGARDCPRDKPAPDPIFKALDGTGIAPDETVWMVGDTPADLKCAHAAGCLPVLVGGAEELDGAAAGPSAAASGTEL